MPSCPSPTRCTPTLTAPTTEALRREGDGLYQSGPELRAGLSWQAREKVLTRGNGPQRTGLKDGGGCGRRHQCVELNVKTRLSKESLSKTRGSQL